MRQILVVVSLLVLCGGAPAVCAAADPKKEPIYQHGKEEFDLRKEEQRQRLMEVLLSEKPHELKLKSEKSFLSTLADQAIWTLLVFGGLLFILWRYAWAPIQSGLHKRETSIEQAFEEAREARAETEKIKQALAAEQAQAHEQARAIVEKASKDAQQTVTEELARGKIELAAERDRLRRELRISTDDALHKMWDQSARLATLISSKAIHKQLNYDDHRALLGEALAEFRQAVEGRKLDIESARA